MKIEYQQSPSYGRRGSNVPDVIVCHITEGNIEGAIATLKGPKLKRSSNYVVGRDGRVVELVSIMSAAFCNGTQSINPFAANYYKKATSKIVKSRSANANYYTISIEHVGFSKDGGTLTELQIQASADLIKFIKAEVKLIYDYDIPIDREHIIGHCEIDPKNKSLCPGLKFPYAEIMKRVIGDVDIPKLPKKDTVMKIIGIEKWSVFEKPSGMSKKVYRASPGNLFEVEDAGGGWAKVKSGAIFGFMDWKAFK